MEVRERDEILELIWTEKEKGEVSLSSILESAEPKVEKETIDEMERSDYLRQEGGKVILTEKGEKFATQIIRCHRLAERMLQDVLELRAREFESSACTFEHVLSPEVADAICTLLGHPRQCPHGKPIPEGECCLLAHKEVGSIILPLSELSPGEVGKITYITTRRHSRLDRLTSFGLFPGVAVKVHQTFPSFVIQLDETQVALDKDILKDIYVRKISPVEDKSYGWGRRRMRHGRSGRVSRKL